MVSGCTCYLYKSLSSMNLTAIASTLSKAPFPSLCMLCSASSACWSATSLTSFCCCCSSHCCLARLSCSCCSRSASCRERTMGSAGWSASPSRSCSCPAMVAMSPPVASSLVLGLALCQDQRARPGRRPLRLQPAPCPRRSGKVRTS